jgi:D-alanine-D-alanine ligase
MTIAARSPAETHVAVIMGGWSAEREVSLSSGRECANALEGEGFKVSRVDADRTLATTLAALKPDVVFNALHGRWGEDGCVQGILEVLGIAYTHSGVMASAVAMNKEQTRRVAAVAGIPIAEGRCVTHDEALADHIFAPPYVAKPISEGSSIGVVIVREGANRPPETIRQIPVTKDGLLLVERFIAGQEFTCCVIGDRVSDVIDIVSAGHLEFYDYEAKYAPGGSRHILPAQIPDDVRRQVQAHTLVAHKALGCRGVSRSDFRWDKDKGQLVFLETNTQPGMTPTSLVPELAEHMGLTFGQLCAALVRDASVDR